MSQSNKKSDILFFLFILLIIFLSITTTYFAIQKHNVNKSSVTNNKSEEEIQPYLVFEEVTESKTVDVFKNYPVNPIDINFKNNTVTISGLKDKEVENKVNENLSILDSKKNEYGYNQCYTNFNVSNVLSITCKTDTVNVNLVTGDEITLEEIFNTKTDLYSILVKSNYESECSWQGCYYDVDFNEEYYNSVENIIAEHLQNIKNNDYILELTESNAYLKYPDNDYNGTYISYGEYIDEVTIYDRFLNDDNIYEKEINEYCTPNSCYKYRIQNDNTSYIEEGFLNDKTYLKMNVSNYTNRDVSYDNSYELANLDLKKVTEAIKKEIVEKEKLNTTNPNYLNLDIYVNIYYHTSTDYQVTYTITKKEYTKSNFIKERLGVYYQNIESISERRIDKVNMLLDKNDNITYLEDNPRNKIPDFENKLYSYIMSKLNEKENYDFTYYNTCEFADDYEKCQNEKDYHNLIKEASYALDEINHRLYMYEVKPGIGVADSYVNAIIPLQIFEENHNPSTEEEEENNNEENINDTN